MGNRAVFRPATVDPRVISLPGIYRAPDRVVYVFVVDAIAFGEDLGLQTSVVRIVEATRLLSCRGYAVSVARIELHHKWETAVLVGVIRPAPPPAQPFGPP